MHLTPHMLALEAKRLSLTTGVAHGDDGGISFLPALREPGVAGLQR
jgi:hypothetical protein